MLNTESQESGPKLVLVHLDLTLLSFDNAYSKSNPSSILLAPTGLCKLVFAVFRYKNSLPPYKAQQISRLVKIKP